MNFVATIATIATTKTQRHEGCFGDHFVFLCYSWVRRLPFFQRISCCVLHKLFYLRGLHGEDFACYRPGCVSALNYDVMR